MVNLMFHSMSFHDIIIDEAHWIKYQVKSNHKLMKNRALISIVKSARDAI